MVGARGRVEKKAWDEYFHPGSSVAVSCEPRGLLDLDGAVPITSVGLGWQTPLEQLNIHRNLFRIV